ncbi:MAG: hypothetical protein MAG431_02033 [Chloroflexi bacterium]|nr:hypothetical protein [Chloroflexota bacterium]
MAYAEERGLNEETVAHFKFGSFENYLTMPTFENERLINVKFRKAYGKGIRYYVLKGSRKSFFNHDEVAYTSEPVVVTKGHIPTALLWQHGILSANITAGENATLEEYWPILALSSKRILVGDNDADRKVREKMQEFTRTRAKEIKAEVKFPPLPHKDVDDWILADPSAISIIKGWI